MRHTNPTSLFKLALIGRELFLSSRATTCDTYIDVCFLGPNHLLICWQISIKRVSSLCNTFFKEGLFHYGTYYIKNLHFCLLNRDLLLMKYMIKPFVLHFYHLFIISIIYFTNLSSKWSMWSKNYNNLLLQEKMHMG